MISLVSFIPLSDELLMLYLQKEEKKKQKQKQHANNDLNLSLLEQAKIQITVEGSCSVMSIGCCCIYLKGQHIFERIKCDE